MPPLRLAFADFIFGENSRDRMAGFNPADNVFTRLIRRRRPVEVVPASEAEVLFYSTFGEAHRGFVGKKIFYTSENVLPDFDACDHAITFCHLEDPRHLRLPQYVFYVDDPRELVKGPSAADPLAHPGRTEFCAFVVTNPRCPERNRFFKMLNRRKRVGSAGRLFNNTGTRVGDKLAYLRRHKFTLAFENSSSPGYTTEKIVEAMLAGSLPIYWGNPEVARDFNPRSFIDVSRFRDFGEAIEHILAVDADDSLYRAYAREPWFHGNAPPVWFDHERLADAIVSFLAAPWSPRPRTYRDRGLRDHALGTGWRRHLSSLACKAEAVAWNLGLGR